MDAHQHKQWIIIGKYWSIKDIAQTGEHEDVAQPGEHEDVVQPGEHEDVVQPGEHDKKANKKPSGIHATCHAQSLAARRIVWQSS